MASLSISVDKVIRRLRWVMVFAILMDLVVTLAGQPAIYWHDPSTANESNAFIRLFMVRGYLIFCLCWLCYTTVAAFAVPAVRRMIGVPILFLCLLGHYFGASTWFVFHFDFGMSGAVAYAVVLASFWLRP
jgi:hypothetical protein